MSRMYSARHYQNVASILAGHAALRREAGDNKGEALVREIIETFSLVFESDSPLVERKGKVEKAFQTERFKEACSPNHANGFPPFDRRSK